MELYIIRHAIAVDPSEPGVRSDEDRWLTPEGIEKMREAAQGFARLVPELDRILSSPLVRARQTADLVAEALNKKAPVAESGVLAPSLDFKRLVQFLREQPGKDKIGLVGHEPDLSELISLLVAGSDSARIEMGKGAIAMVEISGKPDKGAGVLRWLLPPKVLRQLA